MTVSCFNFTFITSQDWRRLPQLTLKCQVHLVPLVTGSQVSLLEYYSHPLSFSPVTRIRHRYGMTGIIILSKQTRNTNRKQYWVQTVNLNICREVVTQPFGDETFISKFVLAKWCIQKFSKDDRLNNNDSDIHLHYATSSDFDSRSMMLILHTGRSVHSADLKIKMRNLFEKSKDLTGQSSQSL